jgi:uncharacterized protein YcbX
MKTISSLHVYPIKSCKGLSLKEVTIEAKGPQGDRRWMVVDVEGRFLTQRKFPQMALIEVHLDKKGLKLFFPGSAPIHIPLLTQGRMIEVEVWKDHVMACDQGDVIAQALSAFLETECRLVYIDDRTVRKVDPRYATHETDQVSFADGFPFLLISEASLEDLNRRLPEPVPMERFRPNLVVAGSEPYAEDRWKKIRLGEIELSIVKPCSRCVITTVNQQTGVKGLEPLQTLATYRKAEKGIMFGQNAIHHQMGVIHVGDAVEIIEWH